MPSLGADMEAGTLLEWRVKRGDRVKRGEIVALVDTDKAEIEVEIFCDGVVEELLVEPGRKVPVGTLLARIREPGAAEPEPPAPPATAPAPEPVRVAAAAAPAPAPPGRRASPLARRRAAELGVDLAALQGSGEGGAIQREDVERAAAARAPSATPAAGVAPGAAPRSGLERAAGMRRAIAAAMARSKREIPHYYLASRVDLTRALRWLEAYNASRPPPERMLPAALLLRSVALALRETPELNGHWIDGELRPSTPVHLGVAIALRGGGLLAPALHDAERLPLPELMAALRDLVQRARSGGLRSSELADATITVTNLGDLGVEQVFGVIYPPQVALVGFGRVSEQPWAVEGALAVRPVVTITLAADHRASDGQRGARLLAAVERLLQAPEAL
jgi:pyruvate dehydrogenase E2 component (dihydrolipoamide acetyltransferase)